MRSLKKITRFFAIHLLFLLFCVPIISVAEQCIVWRTPGTCPRKQGGIWSIAEHKKWVQSFAGQNDLIRAGLPERIRKLAVKLTQEQLDGYGREVMFPTGERGIVKDITALKGTKYSHLTFGDGRILNNVLLGFDSHIYRTEITDLCGIKWVIDTHKICANQGDYHVNIITPKPPPTLPPITEEIIKYYYEEVRVFVPEYQLAKEKSVQFKGIWDGLSRILAQVWRRPDNIQMNAYGGNFAGGSWTQSNFNNQNQSQGQAQGQGQSNYNSNTNNPTFNNTSTNNNNNINQNSNSQNDNSTINIVP